MLESSSSLPSIIRRVMYCGDVEYLVFWLLSVALYFGTLAITERWQKSRKTLPPLHDRAFELIPRFEMMAYLTDGIGVIGAICLVDWVRAGDADTALAVKEALVYSGVGYLFSSSLHSVTLLPSSNHSVGLPGFGGNVDKLMSNHTFHFGLFLRICINFGTFPMWALPIAMLLYSVILVSTRAHYAVDIVLAWWALGLVFCCVGISPPEGVCLAS